jgi:HEAT repeat protein
VSSLADLLRTALHDRDPQHVRAAEQALLAIPAEQMLDMLVAGLRDGDVLAQRRAARLLGDMGVTAAIPDLGAKLGSPRWTVREAAARSLGLVGAGSTAAREALLLCALNDRTALVRDAASQALARLSATDSAIVEGLCVGCRHRHPRLRCRALRTIAALGQQSAAVPTIQTALTDSDARVRRTAAKVLADLGAAGLPALPALLRRSGDRDPHVAAAAGEALRKLGMDLSGDRRAWLEYLGSGPAENLPALLAAPDIPAVVLSAFTEACWRRVRWYSRLFPGETLPEPAAGATVQQALEAALTAAAQAEAAHAQAGRDLAMVQSAARRQEAGWLAAWLWAALVRDG